MKGFKPGDRVVPIGAFTDYKHLRPVVGVVYTVIRENTVHNNLLYLCPHNHPACNCESALCPSSQITTGTN